MNPHAAESVSADTPAGVHANRRVEVRQAVAPSTPADQAEIRPGPWQLQRRVIKPRAADRLDVKAVRERQVDWLALPGLAESAARAALRARLVGKGPIESLRDEALGCVAAKVQRALGQDPSERQLQCAQGLLEGQLMDMAHGDGKSLSIAMAAAAFALSGEPVHVFAANDYLAARDARRHAPMFVALGLKVGIVTSRSTAIQRQAAYAADLVYSTVADLARDHLRESHHAQHQPGAGMASWFPRGLCCALVDDVDHVLMDEATRPLDLVEVHEDPDLHAACIVALAVARRVRLDVDAVLDVADSSVDWTAVGLARLELLSKPLGEGWLGRSDRETLLSQALLALHALHADHDYLLRDDRVELLPPVVAPGSEPREWPRTLQSLVEIKEGCRPSPQLRTVARTRLQRFFPLYKHLAGAGACLSDCADDLLETYALRVVPVASEPLRALDRSQRVFEAACLRESAAVQSATALLAERRAVLLGVSDADAAAALSASLLAAGIQAQMVQGLDEAQDAEALAQAGQPGTVTVLVQGCGRGVGTPPSPELAAVGGLHVVDMMDSPSLRVRQQFLQRAHFGGAAGTAEVWHAADMPCWDRSWIDLPVKGSPQWMVDAACRTQQLVHRWTTRRERRRLLAEPLQA
jgi:preprotein translocase subunit SecA